MDITEIFKKLVTIELGCREDTSGMSSHIIPSRWSISGEKNGVVMLFKDHKHATTLMKFTYVVACQIYGAQNEKKDPCP